MHVCRRRPSSTSTSEQREVDDDHKWFTEKYQAPEVPPNERPKVDLFIGIFVRSFTSHHIVLQHPETLTRVSDVLWKAEALNVEKVEYSCICAHKPKASPSKH